MTNDSEDPRRPGEVSSDAEPRPLERDVTKATSTGNTLHGAEGVEALARDLLVFLRTSPSERGAPDALQARVKVAIGQGPDGAPGSRAELALLLARALAERPTSLLKDLQWISTFDDQFEMRAGTTKLPLETLTAWFGQVDASTRTELLSNLDARAPWSLVAAALAESDAELEDVVALCAAHAERGETRSNALNDGIFRWAGRSPQAALAVLERWREQQLPKTRPCVLEALVRAIAGAGLLDPQVRAGVVTKLVGSLWHEAREAGLGVECFAWPSTTPVEDRHNAVLSLVGASPRLATEALRAFARDAWNFPKEAISSGLAVLSAIEGDVGLAPIASEMAPEVANVLVAALADETKTFDLTGSELLLEILVVHPLGTGNLDHALACWHQRDSVTAQRVLETLLKVRGRELAAQGRAFREIFPLVSMKLGDSRRQAWLLEATQSADIRLRSAAWYLLANDSCPLTARQLTGIPDSAVKQTAADVAAHSTLGAKRIEVLVLLGASHPTTLAELLPVAKEVALEYPGTAREALAQWKVDESNAPGESPLRVAASEIEAALAARQTAFEEALAIPEVVTLIPTRAEWLRAENQATERAMKEARGRSVFASLVSSVTIVRGGSSSFMGGPPTPMQEFGFSVEGSREQALDPIGAFEKRLATLTRLFPKDNSKA